MVKQMKRLKDVLPKPKQTVDVDVDDRENVEPTKADEAVSQEQTIPSGSNTAPKVMQPVSPQQVTTAMQPASPQQQATAFPPQQQWSIVGPVR